MSFVCWTRNFSLAAIFFSSWCCCYFKNITFDRIKLIRVEEVWNESQNVELFLVTFSIVSQCTKSEHKFCNLNHIFNSFYFYHLQKVIRLFNLFNKLIELMEDSKWHENVIWTTIFISFIIVKLKLNFFVDQEKEFMFCFFLHSQRNVVTFWPIRKFNSIYCEKFEGCFSQWKLNIVRIFMLKRFNDEYYFNCNLKALMICVLNP